MSGSEIARILQQIRAEEEAARRAMYDIAQVGTHQFINVREANIGQCVSALVKAVGSEPEAIKMFIAVQEEVEKTIKNVVL